MDMTTEKLNGRTRRVHDDEEALELVREMLLMGLACYGEIERLRNACDVMRRCGKEVPEDLEPIDQSGLATTIGDFAGALINVDCLVFSARKKANDRGGEHA